MLEAKSQQFLRTRMKVSSADAGSAEEEHLGESQGNAWDQLQAWQSTALRRIERLSPREVEVLGQVVDGFPNKTIARRLAISTKTVEKHRSNAMRKLQVLTFSDLMRVWLTANPFDLLKVFRPHR